MLKKGKAPAFPFLFYRSGLLWSRSILSWTRARACCSCAGATFTAAQQSDSLPPAAARVLGTTNAQMINTMVCDIIETSLQTGEIGFSDPVYEAMQMLVRFNYEQIYRNPKMTAYHDNFERILTTIYDYLLNLMQKYGRDSARYTEEPNSLAAHFADYLQKMAEYYTGKPDDEAAFDYLAGMTDDYAIDCVSEIMLPKSFQIKF